MAQDRGSKVVAHLLIERASALKFFGHIRNRFHTKFCKVHSFNNDAHGKSSAHISNAKVKTVCIELALDKPAKDPRNGWIAGSDEERCACPDMSRIQLMLQETDAI